MNRLIQKKLDRTRVSNFRIYSQLFYDLVMGGLGRPESLMTPLILCRPLLGNGVNVDHLHVRIK